MKFSTTTLGCKANQYDTETIEGILLQRGHEHINLGDGCDVCIINTCAVTAEAVRKSRQAVRRMKKLEPNALIAVCGCYSQLEGEAAALLGADLIGGTRDREGFADKVEQLTIDNEQLTINNAECTNHNCQLSIVNCQFPTPYLRTRPLLKIQDGCDNRCAYCVIPQVRGRSRPVPLGEIEAKARALGEQGYKEIVITGIEICSYKPSLIAALQAISAAAPMARLRLGSLDPKMLTDDYNQKLAKIPNLCKHFHISLQSGCDETLRRMGRGYDTSRVLRAIDTLRSTFDNCAITADLIIGFPGETDAEFENTLGFLEKAMFAKIHIFPYSKRPGTRAAELPNQVDKNTARERVRIAAEIEVKHREAFLCVQIGKTLEVLFERQKGKYSIGHSSNYLSVAVKCGETPCSETPHGVGKNTIGSVLITGVRDEGLIGEFQPAAFNAPSSSLLPVP